MRLAWHTGLRGPLLRTAVERWLALGRPIDRLFACSADDLAGELDLPLQRMASLLASPAPDQEVLDTLAARQVALVPVDHPDYPATVRRTLGFHPPLLLAMRGAGAALQRPGVAVIGRRQATEEALQYARELAARLVAQDLDVLSGHAPGIDQAAHDGAAQAGGPTTAVLAEGILSFRGAPGRGPDLIVSQWPPRAPWRTGQALARNGLVTALASVVVVVQSGPSGGTWRAAHGALAQGRPVLVRLSTDSPGATGILAAGGQPLSGDVERDIETIQRAMDP
ncbi:MAG: DNA-processing protein DprA [Armatimonadetes bacterium]|nr:DNA-processing protein DprA [Armatimonadota bacterium]